MASERDNMAVGELQMDLTSQSDGTSVVAGSNAAVPSRTLLSLPAEIRQQILANVFSVGLRPLRLRHVRGMTALPETPSHHRAGYAKAHLNSAERHSYAQLRGLGVVCRTFQQDLLQVERLWLSRCFALDLGDFLQWVDEAAKNGGSASAASCSAAFSNPLPRHREQELQIRQRTTWLNNGRAGQRPPVLTHLRQARAAAAQAAAAPAPLHSRGNLHVTLLLFDEDWVAWCPPAAVYLVGCALASFYMRGDCHRPWRDVWRKHPVTLDPYPITGADAFTYAWVEALHRLSPELVKSLGIRSVEIVNTRRMVLWDEGRDAPFGMNWAGAPALSHVKVGKRVPVWMVGYLRVVLEMLGLPDAVWVEHEDCGEDGRMDWSA
ncbi:hypothetical protein UCDDS831_g03064 [Diplodia seriata]|uniref:Uncharacterized protein n=1 Tax=Diplodia seriata TaxID=420778 RepID=A0A0G2GIH6_9PEZI|nr:hypothetical protein UCDDS831_g03064 [Diplodia seriata]